MEEDFYKYFSTFMLLCYRAGTWRRRDPEGKTALRSWFNVCEYCLHFFKVDTDNRWKQTGQKRIDNDQHWCEIAWQRIEETERKILF